MQWMHSLHLQAKSRIQRNHLGLEKQNYKEYKWLIWAFQRLTFLKVYILKSLILFLINNIKIKIICNKEYPSSMYLDDMRLKHEHEVRITGIRGINMVIKEYNESLLVKDYTVLYC